MKEFEEFLQEISQIPEIQKIIPWRISRQQKSTSHKTISFSYFTNSGLKLKIKKWATAQEVFIVCKAQDKEKVKNHVLEKIK